MISRIRRLPEFVTKGYVDLLSEIREQGYNICPVHEIRQCERGAVVFLRHDVDFSIELAVPLADIEAGIAVRSTYFVLLTGFYNPFHTRNRSTLKHLVASGHEIGLHYDMTAFPQDDEASRIELDKQVAMLSDLCGTPVRSIVMHHPHKGQPDPFLQTDEYIHPHDPRLQKGLVYISDSCRAWRDETLLSCFSVKPPSRVLLNTHPELYLAENMPDRIRYLLEVLAPRVLESQRRYFEDDVRHVWETHPAPRQHDAREAMNQSGKDAS